MTTTQLKKLRHPTQPLGCWIRPNKRLAIYLRDRYRCSYCNADLSNLPPELVSLDHLNPQSQGGSNHESNLTTACTQCNYIRGTLPLEEFATPSVLKKIVLRAIKDLTPFKKLADMIKAGDISKEVVVMKLRGKA